MISNKAIAGFAVGVGVSAAGYMIYKKNKKCVDAFLRDHGVNVPPCGETNYNEMSIEELVLQKENLEDIIAEREQAQPTEDEPIEAECTEESDKASE